LGLGVVEGSVTSDIDWLYRDNFVIEKRRIVEKETQVRLDASGQAQIVPVEQENSRAACLPEKWLMCIAQFTLALENLFGRPQEVEWAIAGGQVWILQSRPITALPPDLAESAPFPVAWEDGDQFYAWEPAYYGGYRHDPPLPLEYDQFEVIESIREEACRFMGVERNLVMKQFNGRPYSRPVPVDWSDADRRIRHQALEDWHDRLFDEGRSLWDVWGPEVEKATERLRDFDLMAANGAALADHLGEALAAQRRHAFIHPLCNWRPRKAYFDAYMAVTGEAGPEAELAATQLLGGEDNPLTRLVDALYELAAAVQGDPFLEQLLRDPSDSSLAKVSSLLQNTAVTNFRQQLEDLLSVYGERHGHGYGSRTTVHTPTWREQPSELLRLAAPYLDPDIESPAVSRARAQRERDERVEAMLAACADEEAVAEFRRLLANGRYWWTVLEIHNHYIDQIAGGQLRHATMAAAGWLVNSQSLPDQEDVFWLAFAEILDALSVPTPPDLAFIIRRRKEQHAAWAKLIPPPLLGLPEASLPERPSLIDDVTPEPAAEDPALISGQAAASGQVTGRARIVQDENSLPELNPGDILVARNVGPRWTPIFPLLGGLVLETGSIGQHAAVTAREYGIVAVIGTGDATKRIPDKSWVFVDGTRGIVLIREK
jgi:pyruvate,water dikinase